MESDPRQDHGAQFRCECSAVLLWAALAGLTGDPVPWQQL